ncbi:unnamed protein product, partial [marine sediment metagenome]
RNGSGLLKRPGRLFISGCSKSDIEQTTPPTGGWDADLLDPPVTDFLIAIKTIPAGGGSLFQGELVVEQYEKVEEGPPNYTYVAVDTLDATVEPGSRMSRKGRDTGLTEVI